MTKKQKKTLIEILITAVLLLVTSLIYPLIVKNFDSEIVHKHELFYEFDKASFHFYIQLALYLISYIIIGWKIVLKSIKNISKGKVFDEFFLMSLATIVAFSLQEFFEGVAVMLFYQIGELFQSIAVEKSRKSITSLMDLAPNIAHRINENNEIEDIDVDEVNINDILLIKVGDKVPVDGIVIEGESTLDTSSLTGESLPREIALNDEIMSGVINLSSVIKIKATSTYENSTIYKILSLIEDASSSKGKTEQFISKFAKYYTPTVVILALILAVIPPFFDKFNFVKWILRAMSFLVISCPCALVVSIPLSFFSGIGKASKQGILIKGSVHLEDLSKMKAMFFDKTGTLTTGKFTVNEVINLVNDNELKSYFKSLEKYSSHPLAKAICEEFKNEKDIDFINVEEISGRGIKALYNNEIYICGNAKLLKENNIDVENVNQTVVYLAKNNSLIGYVTLDDKLKDDTVLAIEELKKQKVSDLIMITGDKEEPALKIKEKAHLTSCYSSLLPNDKLEIVKNYITTHKDYKTGYVGDGINDAPTLALADVSFAMGKNGSTLAMESADIVIMDDSLLKISKAKKIANKTMLISYENIVFCLLVKVICLVLGSLGIGEMFLAIFADVGVLILCVLNSMRNYYLN